MKILILILTLALSVPAQWVVVGKSKDSVYSVFTKTNGNEFGLTRQTFSEGYVDIMWRYSCNEMSLQPILIVKYDKYDEVIQKVFLEEKPSKPPTKSMGYSALTNWCGDYV